MKQIQLPVLKSFLCKMTENKDIKWGGKKYFIYKILLNYLMYIKTQLENNGHQWRVI